MLNVHKAHHRCHMYKSSKRHPHTEATYAPFFACIQYEYMCLPRLDMCMRSAACVRCFVKYQWWVKHKNTNTILMNTHTHMCVCVFVCCHPVYFLGVCFEAIFHYRKSKTRQAACANEIQLSQQAAQAQQNVKQLRTSCEAVSFTHQAIGSGYEKVDQKTCKQWNRRESWTLFERFLEVFGQKSSRNALLQLVVKLASWYASHVCLK